ncbi:YhcG family protein [Deinococcus sp. QL22]|uniref:PDDEXK nuclease domain-containing protein n=1 Tax=Deinococcus sp. QL22 TaxID=2939437 RepID=UPI00201702C8|nr:PDDEXK nuclease domain-containing protein [Deinococcus sp. QL22]UQN10765.1 PDDEXK nuclease domain-containing protein [Deinococcus sp. QL22]UQN10811.1 PDDEXK nuclease domain-containing protein [Deinococcus sp. QL22]
MTRSLQMPDDYATLLGNLKTQIRQAQTQAALSVNRELVLLYWQIGQSILERQGQAGWGAKVIDRLAQDLKTEFPEMKGFSRSNLSAMQQFAATWPDPAIVQQLVGQIPWGHNVALLQKVKDPAAREWYARATIQHGWSRNILIHQIDSRLIERQGQATSNFDRALPAPQSELAGQLLKDPYNFDFLSLGTQALERDLERSLLAHLRDFMLELGVGFAFVGSQVHLEVGGEDFYLDLLFYHLKLRCYVVIDLKIGEFKPEYVGKMNFYLSAADDLLRHPQDAPSIGLLLCKTQNKVIAEYALRGVEKPLGIASYQLAEALPDYLEGQLPSVEELEAELSRLEEGATH